ncbi:hypothetical protein H2199_008999 [Coniosporium tulheliwenetii]|uniref:Uncharacterized protein n=1 Tax=Coniosporium tulheliwenetii TaxID=3383036 RepID=A0ACC2YH61_9PEZI|nr:hypothetical protein H2199_008999 [Cladosporium sp. JES 115]
MTTRKPHSRVRTPASASKSYLSASASASRIHRRSPCPRSRSLVAAQPFIEYLWQSEPRMTTSLFRESEGEEELPANCGPAHALKGRRCVSPRVGRNTTAVSGEGIALGDKDITPLGGEGTALLDPFFSAESSAPQVGLDQPIAFLHFFPCINASYQLISAFSSSTAYSSSPYLPSSPTIPPSLLAPHAPHEPQRLQAPNLALGLADPFITPTTGTTGTTSATTAAVAATTLLQATTGAASSISISVPEPRPGATAPQPDLQLPGLPGLMSTNDVNILDSIEDWLSMEGWEAHRNLHRGSHTSFLTASPSALSTPEDLVRLAPTADSLGCKLDALATLTDSSFSTREALLPSQAEPVSLMATAVSEAYALRDAAIRYKSRFRSFGLAAETRAETVAILIARHLAPGESSNTTAIAVHPAAVLAWATETASSTAAGIDAQLITPAAALPSVLRSVYSLAAHDAERISDLRATPEG